MFLLPVVVMLQVGPSPASPSDLEKRAIEIFAVKCVECHGSTLPHPKAAFGFITDARRLIDSKKYVVPGKPDESEIWAEIKEGDMPPDEATAGPLTDEEKQAIYDWIASPGAKAAPAMELREPPAPAPGGRPATPWTSRGVVVLGRLHVVLVHFPIALLSTAAGTEAWGVVRGRTPPASLVRVCIWIGGLSALLAAVLGWIHAIDGFPGPFADPLSIAGLHRWLGTAAALFALIALGFAERDRRAGRRSTAGRLAVAVAGLIVLAAAHFGGLLTHGASFLSP